MSGRKQRKLTHDEVLTLARQYRMNPDTSMAKLGREYGVSQVTVHKILNGYTYDGVGFVPDEIRHGRSRAGWCDGSECSGDCGKRHLSVQGAQTNG